MFTASTRSRVSSSPAHALSCAQAVSSTQMPMGRISPVSSASGMNWAGDTRPRVGMHPAYQCLGAECTAGMVHLDLVIQLELTVLKRLVQLVLQRCAGVDGILHLVVEETQGVAANFLGLIHGDVGLFQQLLRLLRAPAKHGRTDTAGTAEYMCVELIGLTQRGKDFLADRFCLLRGLDGAVRSGLRASPRIRRRRGEPRCRLRAHTVARRSATCCSSRSPMTMTQRVVEGLEIIQVDEQQCAIASAARTGNQRMLAAGPAEAAGSAGG